MTDALVLRDAPAEHVARLTLNRPKRRNAIDAGLRDALLEALTEALADAEVRAIVLTGARPSFCAGGDVSAPPLEPPAARARMVQHHRLVRLLWQAEKPLVSAVEGWAVGAGAGLALLCDTVVAGRSARFSFRFLRVGLVPDYGLSFTLPRRVGFGRAQQLLLYARAIGAEEGAAIGLVDVLADDDAVQEAALAQARELADQPRHALALVKRMAAAPYSDFDAALELEAAAQALCLTSPEHEEGKRAFAERREPDFG